MRKSRLGRLLRTAAHRLGYVKDIHFLPCFQMLASGTSRSCIWSLVGLTRPGRQSLLDHRTEVRGRRTCMYPSHGRAKAQAPCETGYKQLCWPLFGLYPSDLRKCCRYKELGVDIPICAPHSTVGNVVLRSHRNKEPRTRLVPCTPPRLDFLTETNFYGFGPSRRHCAVENDVVFSPMSVLRSTPNANQFKCAAANSGFSCRRQGLRS